MNNQMQQIIKALSGLPLSKNSKARNYEMFCKENEEEGDDKMTTK